MNEAFVQQVWNRANSTCEYCRLSQSCSILKFEIDHVIPRKHSGPTRFSNSALSCFYCNRFKGSNVGGSQDW
jgi:5-methylcytosine-specific restriction endonuclease McrA